MVVDRFHAQYLQIAYDEIDFLKEAKIDFYSIQAMFWADLYSPGVKKTTASTPFGIGTANNNQIYLKPLGTGRMPFGFWANPTDGTIGQAKVSRVGTKYQVNCKYQAYRKLQSGKNFPTSVLISIIADHTLSLDMSLSGFGDSSDWETRTTLSSKYTKLSSVEELFSSF